MRRPRRSELTRFRQEYELLGAAIRRARVKQRRTQTACARSLGEHVNVWGNWETGATKISAVQLLRVAHALGAPLAELVAAAATRIAMNAEESR